MATTKARPRAGATASSDGALAKVKDAAGTVRAAGKPALAASAAAAGLAGGVLIGSRGLGRRRPATAVALAGAKRLVAATAKASTALDDLHAIREQLEQANRRSPVEVVLDALTRRPGMGKRARAPSLPV